VQRPTELGEFVALARAADGTTYLVDRGNHGLRVFIADDGLFVEQDVLGSGEGGDTLSLSLRSEQGQYGLYLTLGDEPSAQLLFGDVEQDPGPDAGERLELLAKSDLDDFGFEPLVSNVQVEYHSQAATGEHILVVGPERQFEAENLRVFYGKDDVLVERRLTEFSRSGSAGTHVEFLLDGVPASVLFESPSDDDAGIGDGKLDNASMVFGEGERQIALFSLPRNNSSIGKLTVQCFAEYPGGFGDAEANDLPPDLGPTFPPNFDAGAAAHSSETAAIDSLDASVGTDATGTDDGLTEPTDPNTSTDPTDAETDLLEAGAAGQCPADLPLAACLELDALPEDTFYTYGTVTEAGLGYPERGACAVEPSPTDSADAGGTDKQRYAFGRYVTQQDAGDASWFKLHDLETEEDTLVVLTARGFDPRPLVGTVLDIEMYVNPPLFAPGSAYLNITTTDSTTFWMAEASRPEALSGPVPLSLGDAECEDGDECISKWFRHSINIYGSDGGIGPDVVVPYGTQVETTHWVITNSAVELQSEDASVFCPDSFVSLARAAVWPSR
jgi:hypothetical protein